MSSRILFLDAAAGISGDMFVGALIGAGASPELVRSHVLCLGLDGVDVRVRPVTRCEAAGTKFDVIDVSTGRCVDEVAPRRGRGRPPPRRGLGEIRQMLRMSTLPAPVIKDAVAVFERLGRAEGRVHGIPPDRVHFHEVGAVDAIADIVAAASAFHQLGVEQAWCSPIHVGCGRVRCAHGLLPVPAPATAELLSGVPTYSDGVEGELCTPTGAALARHFCRGFCAMPLMVVEHIGCGAGNRELEIPNLLRATLGRVPDNWEPAPAPGDS